MYLSRFELQACHKTSNVHFELSFKTLRSPLELRPSRAGSQAPFGFLSHHQTTPLTLDCFFGRHLQQNWPNWWCEHTVCVYIYTHTYACWRLWGHFYSFAPLRCFFTCAPSTMLVGERLPGLHPIGGHCRPLAWNKLSHEFAISVGVSMWFINCTERWSHQPPCQCQSWICWPKCINVPCHDAQAVAFGAPCWKMSI